jgi:hypothetical protein
MALDCLLTRKGQVSHRKDVAEAVCVLSLLVLRDAGIVLMHTFTGMGKCPHALQQLIRYFKRKRCSFVKVSSMNTERVVGLCIYQLQNAHSLCTCPRPQELLLPLQVSTLVEQLYGMGPAEVLRKAQECGKPEVVQETP